LVVAELALLNGDVIGAPGLRRCPALRPHGGNDIKDGAALPKLLAHVIPGERRRRFAANSHHEDDRTSGLAPYRLRRLLNGLHELGTAVSSPWCQSAQARA